MKVRVTFNDDTEQEFTTVSPPWTFRKFLCLDTGEEAVTYLPIDNVANFTAPRS